MFLKYFHIAVKLILGAHIFFILLIQIGGFLKINWVKGLASFYLPAVFGQNWSMFAPTPPAGSRSIALSFELHSAGSPIPTPLSEPLDIHEPVRLHSFSSHFGLSQRTSKYFTECLNDLIRHELKDDTTFKRNNQKYIYSYGLQSIKNYARIVFNKRNKNIVFSEKDSLFLDILFSRKAYS